MRKHTFSILTRPGASLARKFKSFLANTTGGAAAITAIVSPVVVGAMALGAEVGYWYLSARELQNGADVAAHAVAVRMGQGDQDAALQTMAEYVVEQADVNMLQTAVAVNTPPLNGAYIEDGNAAEITLNRTVPRLFSAMYDDTPLEISARAVATAQAGGRGCVLALNTEVDGAITITGSAAVNLVQCDFISNSAGLSFDMQGNGSNGMANCVRAAGTADTTANLLMTCAAPIENAGITPDPFAGVTEPTTTGTCLDGDIGQPGQTNTLTPVEAHVSGMSSMRFCNGLDLKGTVNLDPGLYLIEGGDFRINSDAVINGTGVVFYMADGVEARFNGTAAIATTAPIAGTYTGMLFFGSRSATSASHVFNGNAATAYNGAIYTPASHLSFSGNHTTGFSSCTQIVADTITFTGNDGFMFHCLFPPATTIEVAGEVKIVE